jgi:formylglycine-generating enzyme required for sulfatase activity
MSTTVSASSHNPVVSRPEATARRLAPLFAAGGRWLVLALVAGLTLAAQAQRTATATATVMSGFVVDITVTDGGAGYYVPPYVPPTVTITGGGGSGATATAAVSNSAVSRVTVLTTGSGYTSTPSVVIAPPPTPPTLSIQLAPMLVVDGEPGSTARVSYAESTTPTTWVVITNVVLETNAFSWCDPVARSGQRRYQAVAVPPNPSPNPRTAVGTVVVYNGFVIGVTVTSGGEGYLSPPNVAFVGSGSGATATATISNGVVTRVTVNNTGSGYSSASVVFSAPPQLTRLTEYQVPRVTVRQDPPADVLLQSSAALSGTNPWTDRSAFVTSSNGVVWFDLTSTQALSRFYRARPDPALGMALIPAGPFVMGDTLDGSSYALPLHTNLIKAFYMDRTEVTIALWDEVRTWANTNGYDLGTIGLGKATNHPVHTVSWYNCVKWCNARSEQAGLVPAYYTSAAHTTPYRTGQTDVQNDWVKWSSGYRLPTEAEWEKAARGGTGGQRFPWGNTISWTNANYYAYPLSAGGYAYDVNPTSGHNPTFVKGAIPYTSPVGYFAPNGYGLYDMAGNVSRWCWDWYGGYSASPATDPQGPSGVLSYRVLRGGSWSSYADRARCAGRNLSVPSNANELIGFRCVRGL